MPSWNDVLKEIDKANMEAQKKIGPDIIRRKYLKKLHNGTGRNVIAYYSGWLQKSPQPGIYVDDDDKNGFMTTIHKMDRSKGLDLILHTPGGELAAAESLVDYLRQMFGCDIRAIIPQIAMSAGTMISCSCKEIIMGKPSNLGPIDPQINGIPTQGIIEEFSKALKEVKKDPATIPIWQAIIGKYPPSFIGECQKSIKWSEEIVKKWLQECMFLDDTDKESKSSEIVKKLADHNATRSHSRHIGIDECKSYGLNITTMEDMDGDLQDTILTVHHAFMHTFSKSHAIKIIENHDGQAMIKLGDPRG